MVPPVPELRLPVPWYHRTSVHWGFILGMIALFLMALITEPRGNPWTFLPTLSPVLILLINRRHGVVGLGREGSVPWGRPTAAGCAACPWPRPTWNGWGAPCS